MRACGGCAPYDVNSFYLHDIIKYKLPIKKLTNWPITATLFVIRQISARNIRNFCSTTNNYIPIVTRGI